MFGFSSHTAPDEARRFKHLLTTYQEPLYWHIRRITGHHEDAQDALQETFLRAYRNLGALKENSAAKAWLYRIATNEALRIIESRKPTDDEAEAVGEEASHSPDASTIEQALEAAIASLPARQRAVFTLRYYDQLDYPDIAAVLSTTVANATANYYHAKERIRKYLLAL